jgi:osmotically-inducible protein OsmY
MRTAVSSEICNLKPASGRAAVCLSILLLLAGCSGLASTDRQFEDAIVADAVRQALRNDAELARYSINVNVREGMVILTGAAGSQSDVARAGRIAETVAGVRGVENLLTVGGVAGVPK